MFCILFSGYIYESFPETGTCECLLKLLNGLRKAVSLSTQSYPVLPHVFLPLSFPLKYLYIELHVILSVTSVTWAPCGGRLAIVHDNHLTWTKSIKMPD